MKKLEQIAFNTRPSVEEHMLIVLDKYKREEHLAQPLQTNNKQFKTAGTFPTGYNGIFKVKNRNIKIFFTVSLNDDNFSKKTIEPEAYMKKKA